MSNKTALVIGTGGREHAICWKLAQSPRVTKVFAAPGSVGIAEHNKVENVLDLDVKDFQAIAQWCKNNTVDLVVVGPEDPLALGLADVLTSEGILCFGPVQKGARIEADKDWAKQFMYRHNIPTARYESFTDVEQAKQFINSAPFPALVVKASGLAAGKGVVVAPDRAAACSAVQDMLGDKRYGRAGEVLVIEELLIGEEVSILAFTDGESVSAMLPAQDHKRLRNGDLGPNTGGMGAYCPCPLITPEQLEIVKTQVLQRAIDGLRKEGIRYCGVLYAGMMLTSDGPKTLEFNCRFGDPETQVLLPMLDSDLYTIMESCCSGTLATVDIKWQKNVSTVGVVMASKGYPETSMKGSPITGIKAVSSRPNHMVFHSGIASNSGSFITNGGRVLIAVVTADDLMEAAAQATKACQDITFPGAQYRTDIAHKAFKKSGLSYKDSGVDIEVGNKLVQKIKPFARSTHRPGVQGSLGGFGGLFRLNEVTYINKNGQSVPYKDPVLVLGTDGVGTKLQIAQETGIYDSVGVDLVAMCVNDVLCVGAEPVAFLDYIACGQLEFEVASSIVESIAKACKESGCSLLGGETAEMPSIYPPGKYDLAGFCVGVVEHDDMLPTVLQISPGDVLIGLPSSGVHSNGFSLIHKVMDEAGERMGNIAAFSAEGKTYGEEFLTPTRLYVTSVLPVLRKGLVKALAHITGGGILENIPRVLPKDVRVTLDAEQWNVPPVFGWLHANGNLSGTEMLSTFNCGIGMVLVVSQQHQDEVLDDLQMFGGKVIGKVEARNDTSAQQIQVLNFDEVIGNISKPFHTGRVPDKQLSYKSSGVDIVAGESLVQCIKPLARSTARPGVLGGLGGFGGLFKLNKATYSKNGVEMSHVDPVLVMGTDGVGTKLKIAQDMGIHNTIGIDLVAMCANDILCNGAEPIAFLDYYACGCLDIAVAREVLEGIADGCRQAGSVLLGGETAEMPGMYPPGVYDLAGFSLGIVEHEQLLPKIATISPGDVLIGLPSSGVHSNGFSLVHKVMKLANATLHDQAPFSATGRSFGVELLTPTNIYVSAVLPALKCGKVKAVAHITGGGLLENVPRVLPPGVQAHFDASKWNIPPVFGWLAQTGNINDFEMLRTFNCGIGMVLVTSPEDKNEVLSVLQGHSASVIGKIELMTGDSPQVFVENFPKELQRVQRIVFTQKKKVAVLISGTGSNLQALIDATKDTNMGTGAEIVLVISNKPNVVGLDRAANAGIPFKVLKHTDYPSREDFDSAMLEELERCGVELVCLAGFMRILSNKFVARWKGRLINVHPSLLPKFKGTNAQKQALDSGDSVSGCTVHFVDEGVDTGAVIVQERVPILPTDTVESLSQRIHSAEHEAFPKALRLICTGAVTLGEDAQPVWR